MHWPHSAQSDSVMRRLWDTPTVVREPVLATSQMFTPCTFSQIWMQRIHLMHLDASRTSG